MGKYNPLGKLSGFSGSQRTANYIKQKYGSLTAFYNLVFFNSLVAPPVKKTLVEEPPVEEPPVE
jgi:hypothetical protein